MNKILVVRSCAIGDFVLNLPALQALQGLHPGAQFTLVGNAEVLQLARDVVRVDRICSIESEPWRRLFYETVAGLDFDSAIVWMKDPVVANHLRLSGLPHVLHAPPFPSFGHAATHLLRSLGLPAPPLPDLWRPASDRIIVQPGSGSPGKCWPYFGELIPRIPHAYILRGPAEGAEDVLPLVEVRELLRGSRAYIGNDSGITHLAAYLGVPTIALFGPTSPRIWGPIGRRSRIIYKSRLKDITVEEVLTVVGINSVTGH